MGSDTPPSKVQRAHVKLDRAQRAEVQLAHMTILEAEARFNLATETVLRAKRDIVKAREGAQKLQVQILDELDLSQDNLIDVAGMVVLPPEGENFVKEK